MLSKDEDAVQGLNMMELGIMSVVMPSPVVERRSARWRLSRKRETRMEVSLCAGVGRDGMGSARAVGAGGGGRGSYGSVKMVMMLMCEPGMSTWMEGGVRFVLWGFWVDLLTERRVRTRWRRLRINRTLRARQFGV